METFSMKVGWWARFGTVAEWPIALAWKASLSKDNGGSTPSGSASICVVSLFMWEFYEQR